MRADIFAGQPADADLLAAIYDLEHDAFVADHVFYREMARRAHGPTLDLGCGSGRLFRSLLSGGASPLLGIDASPALLRRAERRIAGDRTLEAAARSGRLEVRAGDARQLDAGPFGRRSRFRLVVAAGLLPHMDGPEQGLAMLTAVARQLAPDGLLVLDDIGPAELPTRDLPLSVDWRGELDGRPVVRRSQITRREAPEGVRVVFSTLADVGRPDGTIARLPASYRLWYPSDGALTALIRGAGLAVELAYGSHDLEPPSTQSERRIIVARRAEGAER